LTMLIDLNSAIVHNGNYLIGFINSKALKNLSHTL